MLGHSSTVMRPAVPAGPPVTVAVPTLPTAYDVNSLRSTGFVSEVAALTLPSVYLVDPFGTVALDSDLMTSVSLRTDPQRVQYRINPKATWSDGVPVSCQDFYLAWLSNVSRAADPKDKDSFAFAVYPNPDYDMMKAPRCSDGGSTVTVEFTQPLARWRDLFAGLLPAHVAASDAGLDDITHISKTADNAAVHHLAAAYNRDFGVLSPDTAVSAGPYLLQSAGKSRVVLARNPQWWGHPAGPSEIRLVADDTASTVLASLRNGSADAASVTEQDPAIDSRQTTISGFTRSDQTWPVSEHIEFNMTSSQFTGRWGDSLREAVFHCVDRSKIVDRVARPVNPKTQVLGNLLVSPWNPKFVDHYRDLRTANVVKAKQVLEQAGWKLGADNVYAHGKRKAQFTLSVLPRPNRAAIAAMVKAQCKRAGIAITTKDLSSADLLSGTFQAALFAWSAPIEPAAFAYTYSSDGASNANGYSNKKVDGLFADIAADLKPRDESDRLNRIDKLMAADRAFLPLYDWSAVNLQSTKIHTRLTNNYFWGGLVWDAYAWTVTG